MQYMPSYEDFCPSPESKGEIMPKKPFTCSDCGSLSPIVACFDCMYRLVEQRGRYVAEKLEKKLAEEERLRKNAGAAAILLQDILFDLASKAACYLTAQTKENEKALRGQIIRVKEMLKGDG